MTTLEPLSAGLMMIYLSEAGFYKAVHSRGLRLYKSDLREGKVAECSVIGDNETRKSGWWVTQWGPSRARMKVSMRETLVVT